MLGLAASSAAAYVHYHLLFDPRYASFCDINTTFSCTDVYASRFGTVWGVPVAIFGVIFFVAALLLALVAQVSSARIRENVPGYLFAASTIGLAVILYLGYASFVLLKTICILCLTTYAAVIGLFIVSGAATNFPMTSLPRRALQDLRAWIASPLAVVVTLVFLAGAGSAVAFFPRAGVVSAADAAPTAAAPESAGAQGQPSEFERWFVSQPHVPLIIPAEGAKVLVVKFNDYQCPPCRQSYMAYKDVFAKYDAQASGAVRLVYKDYPLSSECNAYVIGGGPHPSACYAAVAVRLAGEHNRTVQMQEWLFANQPSLTPQLVRQAAKEVGDIPDFDARYNSMLELVKGDIAYGHQLGVRSTPTFFINGVKIEGALPPQYFDQAIAYELAHAGK